MKKSILSFVLLYFSFLQAQNYQFQVVNETYVPLTNATLLSGNLVWDEPVYQINMGFDFVVGNQIFNNIFLYEAVIANFNEDDLFSGTVTTAGALFPFSADLVDRAFDGDNEDDIGGVSPVRYRIDGTQGNRIVKIEFVNAGFYSEFAELGTTNDFVNFQVWLHESTNVIEYRYGPSSILNPMASFMESGPYVAVVTNINLITGAATGLELVGPAAAPIAIPIVEDVFENFLQGMPPNGTVYRFSPSMSRSRNSEWALELFPNPVKDQLFIHVGDNTKPIDHVNIFNSMGQKINAPLNGNVLQVSHLPNGMYVIEISSENQKTAAKFVKN